MTQRKLKKSWDLAAPSGDLPPPDFSDDDPSAAPDGLSTRRDKTTGKPVLEQWRKDGKLDRDDGPARIEYDPDTGVALSELMVQKRQAAP